MNKIINDTLKSPNGKWSRKSLTMFVSFVVSIVLGGYIVMCNYITETPVAENAVDIFQGFMLLTGALSGVTSWEKQSMYKKETEVQDA